MKRLIVGSLLLLPFACSPDLEKILASLGGECLLDSDCDGELVCAFERCHLQCAGSVDCPDGQRCVVGDAPTHVCLLDDEALCVFDSDCPVPMVCGVDRACRDECKADPDCVGGQLCVQATCADVDEVSNGMLGDPQSGQPCSYHSECPDALLCIDGHCRPECVSDADCTVGFSCQGGACSPIGTSFVCAPGTQQSCDCMGGGKGVQICEQTSAGTAWGACVACNTSGPLCQVGVATPTTVVTSLAQAAVTMVRTGTTTVAALMHLNNGQAVDFGLGPVSAALPQPLLVFFDESLTAQSQLTFGSANSDLMYAFAAGPGGRLATIGQKGGAFTHGAASFTGNTGYFLLSMDGTGAGLWGRQWGGTTGATHRVALDANDNVVVVAEFLDTIDPGGGFISSTSFSVDLFVAKYDASGNFLWLNQYGDGGHNYFADMKLDSAGNIIFGGKLQGTIDFGGGPLSADSMGDAFVVKLDANGNHVFSASYGSPGATEEVTAVALDAADDIVLAGSAAASIDLGGGNLSPTGQDGFFAKLDPNGNHLTSRLLDAVVPNALSIDASGNVFVSGKALSGTASTVDECMLASVAQPSPFVAKLDPQGEALWVDRYPVTAGSTAETYALVPMPSGVILGLAGNANNTTLDIDYGDGNGPQQGHTQLFALPAN